MKRQTNKVIVFEIVAECNRRCIQKRLMMQSVFQSHVETPPLPQSLQKEAHQGAQKSFESDEFERPTSLIWIFLGTFIYWTSCWQQCVFRQSACARRPSGDFLAEVKIRFFFCSPARPLLLLSIFASHFPRITTHPLVFQVRLSENLLCRNDYCVEKHMSVRSLSCVTIIEENTTSKSASDTFQVRARVLCAHP